MDLRRDHCLPIKKRGMVPNDGDFQPGAKILKISNSLQQSETLTHDAHIRGAAKGPNCSRLTGAASYMTVIGKILDDNKKGIFQYKFLCNACFRSIVDFGVHLF